MADVLWEIPTPWMYRILARIEEQGEGGWSIISTNLPGCVSQGETIRECLDNLKEAATALIESYLIRGEPIPFIDPPERDLPDRKDRTYGVTVFVKASEAINA